ncbi:MAG: hypothetical protein Alpg2KO_32560 [Alphaproteobacteria bacterium]
MKLQRNARQGATGLSTALLVGLVSIVVLSAINTTGSSTNQLFTTVSDTIAGEQPVSTEREDTPGNDVPEFVSSSISETISEDSGSLDLSAALRVTDPDASQTLTWSIVSPPATGSLGGLPASIGTGSGGTHTPTGLTYIPVANANGSDSFTLSVSDGTASAQITATISIPATNDAPTITLSGNQSARSGDGSVTVPNFATNFSAGPPDESGQSIAEFLVSEQSDPGNVVSSVAIDTSGSLSFTVDANNTGTATIDVRVRDDGGTSNGGTDTSTLQSFDIVIDGPIAYATGRITGGNRDFVWMEIPPNTDYGTVAKYRDLCEGAGFSNNRMSGQATSTSSWNTRDFDAYDPSAYYGPSFCNFFGQGNSKYTAVSNFQNFGLELNFDYRLIDRGCGGYNSDHLFGISTKDRVIVTNNSNFSFSVNHYGAYDLTRSSPASVGVRALIVCQIP